MPKEIVIEEIRRGLQESWLKDKRADILATIRDMPDSTSQLSAAKNQRKEYLEAEESRKFNTIWLDQTNTRVSQQYDSLYNEISRLLLERHPWLAYEDNGDPFNNPESLYNKFLEKEIRRQLFILLENRLPGKKSWNGVPVSSDMQLTWKPITESTFIKEVQGYPLSDPDFYQNRDLPKYLDNPFALSPSRYDIYRLLIKNYKEKFKPTKLANKIVCPKIAPLHCSELETLSPEEWEQLETIIVNVNTEENPNWVLLNKFNTEWTLYKPTGPLNFDTRVIQVPHATCEIRLENQSIYSDQCDWDATLFSRVLPWCELSNRNAIPFSEYRANYPIKLLFQSMLEATCLSTQQTYLRRSTSAFSYRSPFTYENEVALYAANNFTDLNFLLPDIPLASAKSIVSALDKDKITYHPETGIAINDESALLIALQLAYFNKTDKINLKRVIPPPELSDWFNFNLDITTIQTNNIQKCRFIYACAARNRFLQIHHPNYLEDSADQMQARRNAWLETGKYILEHFKAEVEDLTQSANIAQMGAQGLDTFFNALDELPEPASLTCTIDLESGHSYHVPDYIKLLETKIDTYHKKPLFKKLSISLPNDLNADTTSAIGDLIKKLQEKGDISEIHFKNNDRITRDFIRNLTNYIRDNEITIQVHIPAWDNEPRNASAAHRALKAEYRILQNQVLTNIRETRAAELARNAETISTPPKVALPLKLENAPAIEQFWGENEYHLESRVAGIQQQAQQEVAQEVAQQAEQQKEQPAPTKREITPLPDDRELIGRGNLRGIGEDVFSKLVGSSKDGKGIIKFIDEQALEQIQQYSSLFIFGIDSERTPGFRLYYVSEDDNSLVLTFDKSLVAEDINSLRYDPFAICMNDCKPAQEFVGDYRQLSSFTATLEASESDNDLVTLWKFLAKEEIPPGRIADWLGQHSTHPETTEALQHQIIHGTVLNGESEERLKAIISTWSQIEDPNFFNDLFQGFNAQNWQAFGQLFYHYNSQGNKEWLNLAHQVHQYFPEHFNTFKTYLLNPLYDWSECLAQSEVLALTTSMQKLADHPKHQEVLWELVKAHGDSIGGRIRFAEVWQAYDKLITYINNNDLKYDYQQILDAIQNHGKDFNATQFLRRIYAVLQATGNRQDSEDIHNEILQNLNNIDWHESGFYNAVINEHYRYWDIDLLLTGLDPLNGTEPASYAARWDIPDLTPISNPVAYTLRYAAQNLKLNKDKFQRFKQIILNIPNQDQQTATQLMRLATAFLALGEDNLDSLEQIDWTTLIATNLQANIQKINQLLELDTPELAAHSLHLEMQDLGEVLIALNVDPPNEELSLQMLNAISRAKKSDQNLSAFLKYANTHGYANIIVNFCPWLIEESDEELEALSDLINNEEREKFLHQLTSIDFATSTNTPSMAELQQILQSIDSRATRQRAVENLIADGCIITNQDADFAPLTSEKRALFEDLYISRTYAKQNRKLLEKFLDSLAIKQADNESINKLLNLFSELGRKNHYDELGQLLGLLIQKSQDNEPIKYYSLEQLTAFLEAVFNEEDFKNKLYPVKFIELLLNDALEDPESSLLNNNLNKLKITDDTLTNVKELMREINLKNLPYSAKKTLVQVAIKFKDSQELATIVARFDNIFSQLKTYRGVSTAFSEYLNYQLSTADYASLLTKLDMLESLARPCTIDSVGLKAIWADNQLKLLKSLRENTLEEAKIRSILEAESSATRIILTAAISENDNIGLINSVKASVDNLSELQKEKLAEYYAIDPKPSLEQLNELLTSFPADIDRALEYFERVKLPEGKRYYSLTEKDTTDINRVLRGIKLKGKAKIEPAEKFQLLNLLYYTNNYSKAVRLEDKSYEELLTIISDSKKFNEPEAKARVLACLREVIVRKTGKWMNHTQLIDVLYSITHDNDNLLHQVRMGEGKSIISLARVAYRALNGQVVDVYSAKDSLSARDHIESVPVLDVLGIRHAHITPNSSPEQYHNSVENGVGAAHYSTIGGWSLFILGNFWKNGDCFIDLEAEFRAAVLDEGDHLMRIEDTLFNFSDQAGDASIYNYDAWAYKITYDYFMEIHDDLEETGFVVKEIPHLQELYRRLEEGAQKIAPQESQIFAKYFATNDTEARNKKLVSFFTAARLAKGLEEGGPFCIMDEAKEISDSTAIDTRFAKVMINSQVYHGSTYSDLVQQFLHTRLNAEAVDGYQIPNFFIEPESEIVLSLTAPFVLKHFYKQLEAFTGTPGDLGALKFYKDEFGIPRVIKLPTHEEGKTKFLPPIYCNGDDEEAAQALQVDKIVASILDNPDQPVLITCEDDREVEVLGRLIAERLRNNPNHGVVIDTNAAGQTEAEVLKDAGLPGAVTISARLGRGSDIKPHSRDLGLKVLRTYAADPEIVKQEQGRQGRFGAHGIVQDIINYQRIEREITGYRVDHSAEFDEIYAYETEHLNKKLEKHAELNNENKENWQEIRDNEDLKTEYLRTRTLQKLKHNINERIKTLQRQKNYLIAKHGALSIKKLAKISDPQLRNNFKVAEKACRKQIEDAWSNEDEGEAAKQILQEFCEYWQIQDFAEFKPAEDVDAEENLEEHPDVSFREQIEFHQAWLSGICATDYNPRPELSTAIYGEQGAGIDDLFAKFAELSPERLAKIQEIASNFPNCHYISCSAWVTAIELMLDDQDIEKDFSGRLEIFFTNNTLLPDNSEESQNFDRRFLDAVEGVPDKTFIHSIIDNSFAGESATFLHDLVEHDFRRKLVDLCKNTLKLEDVRFLLKALNNFRGSANLVIEQLETTKNLKQFKEVIKPLISHVAYNGANSLAFAEIDQTTAAYIQVISSRSYTMEDIKELDDKLERIDLEEHKTIFMNLLSTIPPHISLRSILNDFDDLPGVCSFEANNTELTDRHDKILEGAQLYTEFLFNNDIIPSTELSQPQNEDLFAAWQRIYAGFSRDMRKTFFERVAQLPNYGLMDIQKVASSYLENRSNRWLSNELSRQENSKSHASVVASEANFFQPMLDKGENTNPNVHDKEQGLLTTGNRHRGGIFGGGGTR